MNLTGAAVLLCMLLGGLLLAAWGTHGLLPSKPAAAQLPVFQAIAAIVLGGLLVVAIPPVSNAFGRPENRRRIGPRQILAGLPDLLIAWTYVVAFAAEELIGSHAADLLVYGLFVEGIAAYTALFASGWGLSTIKDPAERRGVFWAIIACSVLIVGGLSQMAGSFLLFLGYLILTTKRFASDWFDPEGTTESMTAHQAIRCAATLCMFFFIGLPVLALFHDPEIKPVLGAFYFVAMALLEMLLQAPRAYTATHGNLRPER